MFKYIFVLYITFFYAKVINSSKCKEYIVIIPEDLLCPPIKLKDIDWHMYSCPRNSTDVLTYEEFYTNRECVIEMACGNFINKCDTKYKPTRHKENTDISTEKTTASIEDNDIISFKEIIKDIYNAGSGIEQTTEKGDKINPNNEINLIYNDNIKSDLGNNEFNKYIDTKVVMSCDYTENICINEKYVDHNYNITSSIKTIVVSLVKGNRNSSIEYTELNKNITDFNCTSINGSKNSLNKQIIAITYEIIRQYNCKNNTVNAQNNNISFQENHKVNIYTKFDVIFNDTIDSIKCKQNFIFLDQQTMGLECETVEIPKITSNREELDVATTELTNSLIWNCGYKNSHYGIMCDNVQSQKYKLIHFQNCTEDNYNANEKTNLTNSNFIINLNKTDANIVSNSPHKYIRKFGPFSDNFKINFLSNESNYIEYYKMPHITEGRIFNLWSNDEEITVRKYYNSSSLITINLMNCSVNSHELNSRNNDSTGLQLDIILNKQNRTDPNIFVKNYFYEARDVHINRTIINCMYPDLKNSILTTKSILELICEFVFIEGNAIEFKNNDKRSENTEFPLLEEESINLINKKEQYSPNNNIFAIETTTDFSIDHTSTLFPVAGNIDERKEKKEIDKEEPNSRNYINTLPTVSSTDFITNFPTLFMTATSVNNDITEDNENKINEKVLTTEFNLIHRHAKLHNITTPDDNVLKTKTIENITTETSPITTVEYINNGTYYTVTETLIQETKLITTPLLSTDKETSKINTNTTTPAYNTENIDKYSNNTPKSIETTTLMFNIKGQLGYKGNITKIKTITGTEDNKISPIIYIGAILGTICVLSIIAIIAIKLWKPTHKYYGVSKRDNKRDTEESEL